MMENGHINRPFRSYQNGGNGIPPNSVFSTFKDAPTERIVLLSGKTPNLSGKDRPDIKSIGFRPIEQVNPTLDEQSRDYYLDSDLETIEEESSVLESDIDNRSTCSASTINESEATYEKVNGNISTTPTLSSSSSSPYSQTKEFVPEVSKGTSVESTIPNKIVYAKCLSRDENLLDEIRHMKESNALQSMDGFRSSISESINSAAVTPNRNSTSSRREDDLTMSDMFQAVTRGDLSTLCQFSETEQSETVDERGNTILHLAATAGQLQCIQYLMKGPLADAISIPNDELMTPTSLAVMRGHLSCVRWMVENTAAGKELIASSRQASIDGSSMRPPLPHVAARYNQDQVLDWLCEQMVKENYSVDSADYHSNTATHEAAAQGHLKSLQVLVGRGASVTVLNSNGDTPGQVADKNGQDLCVGYLVVVETCMSLAQQLIRVKLENEGLVKDNSALKTQIQAMHEAKLAAARETVEQRIKATLQGISSCDEDEGIEEQQKYRRTVEDNVDSSTTTVNSERFAAPVVATPPGRVIPATPQKTNHSATKENATQQLESQVNRLPHRSKVGHPQQNTDLPQNVPQTEAKQFHTNSSQSPQYRRNINVNQIEKHAVTSTVISNQSDNRAPVHINQPQESSKKLGTQIQVHREIMQNDLETHTSSAPVQAAKAWERMAMDEVLRLARDTRYLPSPTISVRTEDSTMESKEVMRDRMAEASRWFLVQQAGGKAHLKDSRVSQRMRQNSSMNSFARPKNHTSANKPRPMVGPIHQGSKSGPMPARIIPTNSATLIRPNVHTSRQPTQANVGAVANTKNQDDAMNGREPHVAAYKSRPNQIGSITSIRPSSAKSNASSASTLRATDSTPSSPSTSLSGNSVIENTDFNYSNLTSQTHKNAVKHPVIDKKPTSASSSPASSVRSGSEKQVSLQRTQMIYSSPNLSSTAQITVPLPTRNNSFLRKVQPASPTVNRGKSPHKTSTPASSSVESLFNSSPTQPTSTAPSTSTSKNRSYSSFAYFLPRSTPRESQVQGISSAMSTSTPHDGDAKKSNHTPSSSGTGKQSSKRKGKLFRF